MNADPALILTRADIARIMRPCDYLRAVEDAFLAARDGRAETPPPLEIPAIRGAFHAKAALYRGSRVYAALKLNGNFPGNPQRNGLPTIQGAILLCDGDTGALLAIMDSAEITLKRTAAASAAAARALARPQSQSLLLCGAGVQAGAHAVAIGEVLPIARIAVWDLDAAKAARLAGELSELLSVEASAVAELRAPLAHDVIVTCTTARAAFLGVEHAAAGAFVAAIGADNPHKSEIAPSLLGAAKLVTDATAQCAAMGDLRTAIAAGVLSADAAYAELGEILSGAKLGRESDDEVIVFDSTGLGVQDAAAAALVFERAAAARAGVRIALAA